MHRNIKDWIVHQTVPHTVIQLMVYHEEPVYTFELVHRYFTFPQLVCSRSYGTSSGFCKMMYTVAKLEICHWISHYKRRSCYEAKRQYN